MSAHESHHQHHHHEAEHGAHDHHSHSGLHEGHNTLVRNRFWVSLPLTIIVVLYSGMILGMARHELMSRHPGMMTLIYMREITPPLRCFTKKTASALSQWATLNHNFRLRLLRNLHA